MLFPPFVWGRAILKNDWNEVVDLILKPRPGGKGGKHSHTLMCFYVYLRCFKPNLHLYCFLQRRKNSLSAAERSGQRRRTQRQPWKSCPTSAAWRGSCCEACLCMAKRTSSLLLDWFVFLLVMLLVENVGKTHLTWMSFLLKRAVHLVNSPWMSITFTDNKEEDFNSFWSFFCTDPS